MAKATSKVPLLLAAAAMMAGCDGLDREGALLPINNSYVPALLASKKDGISGPDGLLWRDGNLFIADEGNGAIHVWRAGAKLQTIADSRIGISTPEDLVVDGEGNLFFTDDDAGGLWTVSREGKASLLAGKDKGVTATEGIALTPAGDVLVGDSAGDSILRVARDGKVSVFLGPEHGIGKPESMAYDDRGNLYIADNEQDILYLLTPDGKLHKPIRNRDGFSPESMAWIRGALHITDSKNGKLYRYTPEDGLETIAVFGGKFSKVSGISDDGKDGLIVSIQSDLQRKIGYILHLQKRG